MVKKALLSFGMLATAAGAFAQTPIFHESFDAEQTKQASDVAFYEFINNEEGDTRSIDANNPAAGAGCMWFHNAQESLDNSNWWMRAIKFRNLPLVEGKTYRLTFSFKGSNRFNETGDEFQENDPRCAMRVGLMQGGENADIPLLDGNGAEQYYTIDHFNPAEYEKYTRMYHFASEQKQKDQFAVNKPGQELADTYFATFNIYNPGDFFLDEVDLTETSVQDIAYGGDVIRVNFGLTTNIAELAKAAGGRVILSPELAKVKLNGADAAVEAVELHADGYLYIFLEEEYLDAEGADLVVSFTNAEGEDQILYAGNSAVASFDGEAASIYDEALADVTSFAYDEALVVTSSPLDGSFRLDEDMKEFTLTFDHEVYTGENDYSNAPVATLSNGETLAIKEGQPELSKSITFVRTSDEPLAKGTHVLTVTGITTYKGITCTVDQKVTFEVGKVKVAETIYENYTQVWMEGEYNTAQPTNGWIAYFNGEVGTSNANRVGNMVTNGKGVGYYFCQRDGSVPAKLTYGEMDEAPFTLPAGNVELALNLTQWQGAGGAVNYKLVKKGSEDAIVQGTAIGTANTTGFGATVNDITSVPVKIENLEGGDYVLILEQNSGWSGTIFYGVDVKTYTVTEGETNDIKTLADGSFAGIGNGYIPNPGSGWRIHRGDAIRTPGANGGWGGNCATGGGGPRMFDLTYKGMNGKGVYLDGGYNNVLTFGEFLTYTDEEGNEQPETTLDLEAAKYQISYNSALWKAEGVQITFEIIPQAEGFNGTPIFTKTEVIKTKSPGGNASDGSVESMKTQFFWNCPVAGKYMLRFYTNGEGFVGNIALETTASMAVQYTNLLKEALVPAVAELEIDNSDERYACASRDELEKTIRECQDPDFHTAAEYDAVIAKLNALVKAMSARRENIEKFPECLAGLSEGLAAAAGTKYEALAEYPIVKANFDKYMPVDPTTLSDEDLATAVAEMGNMGVLLKNMVNDCVGFLTQQIADLAGKVVEIYPEAEGSEVLIAAGNAITDDQNIVVNLKKIYAAKLYAKIAAGENPFEKTVEVDEGEPYTEEVTLDESAMIQNRGFYTDAKKQTTGALANENSFPGWSIEILQNSILADWGWGGPYNCTDVRPISDAAVCTAWGTSEVNVSQLIDYIPAGIYNVSIKVGDGTSENEESLSYAFCTTSNMEEPLKIIAPNDNGARNAQEKLFENVTAAVDGNFASITIGASLRSRGDFSKCDDAALVMVAKDPNFDYAAAAKALDEEIATSIKSMVEPVGEPVNVKFFSVDGKQIANAKGIAIKVATYKNGFTKVSKVVVK